MNVISKFVFVSVFAFLTHVAPSQTTVPERIEIWLKMVAESDGVDGKISDSQINVIKSLMDDFCKEIKPDVQRSFASDIDIVSDAQGKSVPALLEYVEATSTLDLHISNQMRWRYDYCLSFLLEKSLQLKFNQLRSNVVLDYKRSLINSDDAINKLMKIEYQVRILMRKEWLGLFGENNSHGYVSLVFADGLPNIMQANGKRWLPEAIDESFEIWNVSDSRNSLREKWSAYLKRLTVTED